MFYAIGHWGAFPRLRRAVSPCPAGLFCLLPDPLPDSLAASLADGGLPLPWSCADNDVASRRAGNPEVGHAGKQALAQPGTRACWQTSTRACRLSGAHACRLSWTQHSCTQDFLHARIPAHWQSGKSARTHTANPADLQPCRPARPHAGNRACRMAGVLANMRAGIPELRQT
jgi:hypothetical protein